MALIVKEGLPAFCAVHPLRSKIADELGVMSMDTKNKRKFSAKKKSWNVIINRRIDNKIVVKKST